MLNIKHSQKADHEEKTLQSWRIWQNCYQETTVEEAKGSVRPRRTKTGQLSSGLKSFEVINQSLKSVWWWVGKRAATPCITPTVKHRGGFLMVCEAFANCKVGDLHQVKGKLNQTGNHSVQSYLGHGLWLKDLYSCKIVTQSILENSAKGTLKGKRNSMSFNSCLDQHNPTELLWDELDRKVRAK